MSLKDKLNPWNWFKHEENANIPVKSSRNGPMPAQHPSFNSLMDLHQQVDRIFDHAFRGFGFPSLLPETDFTGSTNESLFRPSLDVSSDENQYLITLDLPGLTESDVNIEIKGNQLFIQGEKKTASENKDKHFYRMERSYGSFQRILALPEDAISSDIQANMKDGVLQLEIPKQAIEEGEVRQVSINH